MNNKGTDQPALMHSLVCSFVIRILFTRFGSFYHKDVYHASKYEEKNTALSFLYILTYFKVVGLVGHSKVLFKLDVLKF